jgi:hypothetical protein
MADTTTTVYAFVKPEVGASTNTWGTKLNADLDQLDALLNTMQTDINSRLLKSGGTMTGFIVLHANPSAALHPATKQYVDAADNLLAPKASPTFTGSLKADQAYTPPSLPGIVGGVLTLNCALSNVFRITMNANVTSLVLENRGDGQSILVRFIQAGTGGTITWPSNFRFPNGANPTLSTGDGDIDELYATFHDVGGSGQWNCSLMKNFS